MDNNDFVTPDVKTLIDKWKTTKATEEAAKNLRLRAEEEILKAVTVKPKGTTHLSDIKIATREELKVDVEIASCLQIPPHLNPFQIKSMSCDKDKLNALKDVYPGIYAQALSAITTVSCKPSFSVRPNSGE